MNIISTMIHSLDMRDPSALPDIRRGSTIVVGSDYSGQHATSAYESLAFVLADIEHCQSWMVQRRKLRGVYLTDGRRFSYKALRDKKLADVLLEFLSSANLIPGLLLVVLTRKTIESLFKSSGPIERNDPEIRSLAHWAPHVIEKLLRIVHFLSLFLAGLSREGQDVLWITDEDDIVANLEKHQELTTTFGTISSYYLRHGLRHGRVVTTASDTGKRDVEDFVAVADLAAGALCDILNTYLRGGALLTSGVILPAPANLDDRSLNVLNWFSDSSYSLKRLVLTIEPVENSTSLRIRHLMFHGSKLDLA